MGNIGTTDVYFWGSEKAVRFLLSLFGKIGPGFEVWGERFLWDLEGKDGGGGVLGGT